MIEKKVDDMYECPFSHDEHYQISDVTAGSDIMCAFSRKECWQSDCLLKKEGEIRVVWNVKT